MLESQTIETSATPWWPRPRRWAGLMLLLAATLSSVGCTDWLLSSRKSMERVAFTQCFMPRESTDVACGKLKEGQGHEHCQWLVNTFYLDQVRQCYGQRWAIPKAYYSHSYGRLVGPTTADTFVIEVGRPGLTPGITELTPGAFLSSEQRIPLYIEVTVRSLSTGKFEKRMREVMNVNKILGMVKANQGHYGLDVYDKKKITPNQSRSIFLSPPKDAQLFVECGADPHNNIETLPSHYGCTVKSNIDDRVYIEYHISYSELPNLKPINTQMTNLIRSFMVNQ